jgi:hypothetical protein
MLNWFNRKNYNNDKKNDEYISSTPGTPSWASLSNEIPPIPEITEASNTLKDHYRVGYDPAQGVTTLTLHAPEASMTLTLVESEVMRLIRLLDATLDYEVGISDDDDD